MGVLDLVSGVHAVEEVKTNPDKYSNWLA